MGLADPGRRAPARLLPWLFRVGFDVTAADVYATAGAGARAARWLAAGPAADARRADAARARRDAAAARRRDRPVPRLRPRGRADAREAVPAPHWYLAGIGVDPAAQRQGIGGALLAAGHRRCGARGLPAVLLTNNEANLRFYERTASRSCARDGRRRMARGPGLWSGRRDAHPRRDSRTATRSRTCAPRPRRSRPASKAPRAPARGPRARAARHGQARLPRPRRPQRAHPAALPAARTGEVDVHLGDVVGAIGKPTKSRRGEPSLIVDELVLLSRIRSPLPGHVPRPDRHRAALPAPLPRPADERGDARDFLLRAQMVRAIRALPRREGFVEVETPILQPRYGGAFADRSSRTTTSSTRTSTSASRPSCT